MLLKLTKECVFSVTNRLIKQTDGCPMGGLISNDYNFEVKQITQKFLSAGFLIKFIKNIIEYFHKDKGDYIIREWLFDE